MPLAPSLDGNTVDAQMEQAAFADNTVRYQATLTFLIGAPEEPHDRHHWPVTPPAGVSTCHPSRYSTSQAPGLSAQSVRLNTVASNLANADSVSGDPATVYKARHPVFEAVKAAVAAQLSAARSDSGAARQPRCASAASSKARPLPTERYEPGNPLANADGNVYSPNVNVIEEMTDMISASRAYQNNVEVMNTSKELMLATLKLGS